jgi:hypothetical protein
MSTSQGALNDLNVAYTQAPDPGTGKAITIKPDGWAQVIQFTIAESASETNTLGRPSGPNQKLKFIAGTVGSGGSRTITVTGGVNQDADTTLVFDAAKEMVVLESFPTTTAGTYCWRVVASEGVTGGGGADIVADNITAETMTLNGNLTQTSAAVDLIYKANTAAALEITDGTTALIALDTRNTIADVNGVTVTSPATTIATAAAAHKNPSLNVAAKTITYTGTNTVTSQLGAMLNVGALTLTDASAGTVSLASAVHITAVAAAGGSLTLTAARMISTSVTDCYLTNAGVWTDTMCWASGKDNVAFADDEQIDGLIDQLQPHKWRYKPEVHGDDGVERVGIMYDELPPALCLPGAPNEDGRKGVSAGLLASFSLAAIRSLRDKNKALEDRIAALEAA